MEIIGSAAAFLLLLAYFLITTGRVRAGSLTYQGLNLLAALGLGTYGIYKTAWANVALNAVWLAIAVIGVATWLRYRQKTSVKSKKV